MYSKDRLLHLLQLTFILPLLLVQSVVQPARILFLFAGGNLSHKTSAWPYVYGLADKGHQITFISSHTKTPKPHSNVKDIAPASLVQVSTAVYAADRFKDRENGNHLAIMDEYGHWAVEACKTQLKDPQVKEIIDKAAPGGEASFDLIVVNSIYGECGTLISQYLETRFIIFDTTTISPWMYMPFGIPWQSHVIPDMLQIFDSYPLSFWDRLKNFWSYNANALRAPPFEQGFEEIKATFFNNASPEFQRKSFTEMEREAGLVLVNSDPAFDFARPMPPWMVYVGGMQCSEPVKELTQPFKDFMDGASEEHGVVLIAFGSTVDLSKLPSYYLEIFFNAMKKFEKVRFIWRWKGPSPDNAPKNLLAADWLPQREILNHRKLRAFMTHCGVGSITEATCYGIPLIAVPLFADQDLNSYRIQAQEVGLKLEIKGLDQAKMDSVLEEILTNPKYKQNVMIRSAILKDQPMNPVQKAVYWTEYVLRHKDLSALKPAGLDQPLFVRHMFDVFLVSVLIFVLGPLILMYAIVKLIKLILNSTK